MEVCTRQAPPPRHRATVGVQRQQLFELMFILHDSVIKTHIIFYVIKKQS